MRPGEGRSQVRELRQTGRGNLKDDVAVHIREAVLSGSMRPGEKIDQDAVSEELGVSRLPVREALIQLENEGLVRNVPRRGAFVEDVTREDIRDHYRMFGMLSGIAVERATGRLSPQELERLEELMELMESARDDLAGVDALNSEFHAILNRKGASRRLLRAMQNMAQSLPSGFYMFASAWHQPACEHHRSLVKAVRDRNAGEARDITVEHYTAAGEYAVDLLERRGFWSEESGSISEPSLVES